MSSRGAKAKRRHARPAASVSSEDSPEAQQALEDPRGPVDVALAGLDGLSPGDRKTVFETFGREYARAQAEAEAEDLKARREASEAEAEAGRRAAAEMRKATLEDRRQQRRERAVAHEQDMKDRDVRRTQEEREGEQYLRDRETRRQNQSRWEHVVMGTVVVGVALTVALFVVGQHGCVSGSLRVVGGDGVALAAEPAASAG